MSARLEGSPAALQAVAACYRAAWQLQRAHCEPLLIDDLYQVGLAVLSHYLERDAAILVASDLAGLTAAEKRVTPIDVHNVAAYHRAMDDLDRWGYSI